MANTERLAALAKVRIARNAIQGARARSDLTPAEQSALAALFVDLDELEDKLILADIAEKIDAVRRDSVDLTTTVDALERASDKLKQELTLVGTAAKAVGTLVGILSTAITHGLA